MRAEIDSPSPQAEDSVSERSELAIGLIAAPGLPTGLAEDVAEDLGEQLGERFPEVEWKVGLGPGQTAIISEPTELIQATRLALLEQDWDLAICLTNIPLRVNRRPVTAHASATDGVGLISVPALGATKVETRVRRAILGLIEGLVGVGDGQRGSDPGRGRVRDRLRELASSIGRAQVQDDDTIRFTTAVVRGNLRLLLGMVRANEPWRVIVRLSKALVAALGTAAYVFASATVWNLATGTGWTRLVVLSIASVVVLSATLIVSHDLWEKAGRPDERERVVLFNTATTLTIALGVLALYLALLAAGGLGVAGLVPPGVLGDQIGQDAHFVDYIKLAWFGTSLATFAGALGSLVESDISVREAAYRYAPDVEGQSGQGADERDSS